MEKEGNKHFILVHGACHGAWCWYKLATLLASAGHQVTALDLTGCGANPTSHREINSIHDYVQPLIDKLASLPPQERVVLVGHSYGGLCLSLAMEKFPEKVSVAVFASAVMPNLTSPPSSILLEHLARNGLEWLCDTRLSFDEGPENPPTSLSFGPKFLASRLYQCCPPEDVTLATALMRPALMFLKDLANNSMLSMENYGSVDRVYIICKDDLVFKDDFQRWIIENNPPKAVKEIDGADHMVMLSKPQELCLSLMEVAGKYA